MAVTFTTALSSVSHAAGVAGVARAGVRAESGLREGIHALAPFAFIRFCVENPEDCRPGQSDVARWDGATKALVSETNAHVNRRIRPVNDRRETWSVDVVRGDCEDFALTKRRELIRAGLPASALRLAVGKTRSGEGHAILLVKTNAGDFVLDNRTSKVLPWHSADLTFEKVSSAENPQLWRRIN
ncbi:MAG: transglutaminase-like cysteine peptidase [Rhizobiaceae bacterium]|nr:transglutaminase-like cysteine peptidase [Rhizobiaceae bacterium]